MQEAPPPPRDAENGRSKSSGDAADKPPPPPPPTPCEKPSQPRPDNLSTQNGNASNLKDGASASADDDNAHGDDVIPETGGRALLGQKRKTGEIFRSEVHVLNGVNKKWKVMRSA